MTLEECEEWQKTAWQIKDSDARTKLDNIRKSKACDRLKALDQKRKAAARKREKRLAVEAEALAANQEAKRIEAEARQAEGLQADELLKATKVQKHLAETLEVEVALSRVVETKVEEDHHQAEAENNRLEREEIQRAAEAQKLAAEAQRLAHQREVDRIVKKLQQDIADAAEEARQQLIATKLAEKKQKEDEYDEACAMYPPLVFKTDPPITSLPHMISEFDSMRRKCNGFMDDKGIQVRGDDDLLTDAYKSHMRSWWDFCRKCEEVCCQSVEHCVRDMRIFSGSETPVEHCDMGLEGKRGEHCIAMCVERIKWNT